MNESEKLAAKRASSDVVFQKHLVDSDRKVLHLQTTLENEKKCADEEAKEHKKMFVF